MARAFFPVILAFVTCAWVPPALSTPISIACNGSGLDPQTGRVAIAGVMTFGFEFDAQAQTMVVTEGATGRVPLHSVKISDELATGTDGKWIYEINRIDGTAMLRTNLDNDPESKRLGIGGNYYKGSCNVRGVAKF